MRKIVIEPDPILRKKSENLEKVDTKIVEDVSENLVISEDKIENENINELNKVDTNDVSNNEILKFKNNLEEVNLDDLEKEQEPNKEEKNKDELQEVDLTFDEEDAITLKNPNEIYLDIYRQAREKAKKAKQEAIKAYLEAKRIKELYMLEIVDSSDEDSDSEEESDDAEDELFSEK